MTISPKQKNYHFNYSILINNSPSKIWNLLTDVDRWKEWDTELLDSKLKEPFELNATGLLIPKKGPRLTFFISELIPNTSYTFVTKMPVGTLEIKRTLLVIGTQVQFTDDIQFKGFLKNILGTLLGRGFKSVLPEVMQNFKKLAELE